MYTLENGVTGRLGEDSLNESSSVVGSFQHVFTRNVAYMGACDIFAL